MINNIKLKKLIEFTKNLTVLYVEDNEVTMNATISVFEILFNTIVTAVDGIDGISKFQNNQIDIVICDINMPQLNGIEMVKKIREIDNKIPVIMATAHQESEYLIECIKIKVDGYLLKPLDISQLEDVLYTLTKSMYCDKKNKEYEESLERLVLERTKELEISHTQLWKMANRDPLTNLYNRRYFNEVFKCIFRTI